MRRFAIFLPLLMFNGGLFLFAMENTLTDRTFAIQVNEAWPATEKLNELWQAIVRTEYKNGLPKPELGICDSLNLVSADYLKSAFTHEGYTMIEGRKKIIHGEGTSIKVKFVAANKEGQKYTGIFRSGAESALMRLSYGVPPGNGLAMVGMAIMFLRDGQKPANVVATPSLDPLPAENIFARDFLTAVPMPSITWKNYVAERSFKGGADSLNRGDLNPRALSLTDLAEMDSFGVIASNPMAPYSLIFRPTNEAQKLFRNARATDDFRVVLNHKGGEGTGLFTVHARETKHSAEQFIGTIYTLSNFVSSIAGDEEIFIKHSMPHPMDAHEELVPCPFSHSLWNMFY
ncbi:MAG TPA: hypothetical protein VEK06_04765 [Myxococcota bacterium]|nr:hypothetical protein [Myxococcota bacterium]